MSLGTDSEGFTFDVLNRLFNMKASNDGFRAEMVEDEE